MEKKRVIKVKNLSEAERNLDIDTTLTMASDCIYIYSGTYKKNKELGKDSFDVEYKLYSNIETGSFVKVPVEFSDLFEKNNHVVFLSNKSTYKENNDFHIPQSDNDENYVRQIVSTR